MHRTNQQKRDRKNLDPHTHHLTPQRSITNEITCIDASSQVHVASQQMRVDCEPVQGRNPDLPLRCELHHACGKLLRALFEFELYAFLGGISDATGF